LPNICIWIQGSVFAAISSGKVTDLDVFGGEEGTEICPLLWISGVCERHRIGRILFLGVDASIL
jgi:hypothetical protein